MIWTLNQALNTGNPLKVINGIIIEKAELFGNGQLFKYYDLKALQVGDVSFRGQAILKKKATYKDAYFEYFRWNKEEEGEFVWSTIEKEWMPI